MNAITSHEAGQQVIPSNNPFQASAVAVRPATNAIADAGQQREIAEVQGAMVIAKRFPRDPIAAMDSILQACTRPSLAEGALYSYSRGGSEITGPSIRLAEVAAQCWGNIQFGIRELEQRNGESTVEAFAWDVQSNTRQVKVFQVPHQRHTKKGSYKLEDPRDVYELVANQGARRLRACILGIIPGDVIESAVKECEQTLKANADTSADGLKKLVAAFDHFGVTKDQIEKRCQCRLEAIRPAQVVQMKKIYASLRDGMSVPGDWFEVDETDAKAEAPAASLREKIRSRAQPAKAAESARPADMDPATGEVPGPAEATAPAPADDLEAACKHFLARLHLADTRDDLDEILNQANAELPAGEYRERVTMVYDARCLDMT